jgi:hypothetical protein
LSSGTSSSEDSTGCFLLADLDNYGETQSIKHSYKFLPSDGGRLNPLDRTIHKLIRTFNLRVDVDDTPRDHHRGNLLVDGRSRCSWCYFDTEVASA